MRPSRRLTPANAGTTGLRQRLEDAERAHPRECGDDTVYARRDDLVAGSPPRMRGRRFAYSPPPHNYRLTPANAGTTLPVCSSESALRAHPRECGDDATGARAAISHTGSPPRMRGRRSRRWRHILRFRLTPANAGTTYPLAEAAANAEAHPRECGDDWVDARWAMVPKGSPPRMRGRLMAGQNTVLSMLAHPRECGDDCFLRRKWIG